MSRVPVVTFRQRGSHDLFEHPVGRSFVLPNHPGRDIAPPLLRDVLNEVGILMEDFRRLL